MLEVTSNKLNRASKAIESIKPLTVHTIHKMFEQKNINEKKVMVFNGVEATIIRILIFLCVIPFVCIWLTFLSMGWPWSIAALDFWSIFLIACILGLLIYAAIIGVLWDVLRIGGPFLQR